LILSILEIIVRCWRETHARLLDRGALPVESPVEAVASATSLVM
jgi:hypothetical protein